MASPRQQPTSDGEVSSDTDGFSSSVHSQDSAGLIADPKAVNGAQKPSAPAEVTAPKTVIRVLIDLNRVGAFIGKGGESIQQLARETECTMGVESLVPGAESRVITISPASEGEEGPGALGAGLVAVATALGAGDDAAEPAALRLLVPGHHIGQLLGKRGVTIAAVRRDTGADIKVLPRGELPPAARVSDEVVTVRGPGAKAALERVAAELATAAAAAAGPRTTGPGTGTEALLVGRVGGLDAAHSRGLAEAAATLSAPVETVLRLLVPGPRVGPLVGKGGEHIERLRRETGADVRVVDGVGPDTPATLVATSVEEAGASRCGAQEAVIRAFLAVSSEETGGRHEARLRLPAGAAGAVLGRKGATAAALRAESGAGVHVEREGEAEEGADGSVVITLDGSVPAVVAALRGVATLWRVQVARGAAAVGRDGRGPGSRPAAAATAIAEKRQGLVFNLDAAQVGALMGKGGANISQVRTVSGARVQLASAGEGGAAAGTRTLEVSGGAEAVAAARNMVNAFLAVGGCGEVTPV